MKYFMRLNYLNYKLYKHNIEKKTKNNLNKGTNENYNLHRKLHGEEDLRLILLTIFIDTAMLARVHWNRFAFVKAFYLKTLIEIYFLFCFFDVVFEFEKTYF